VFGNLTVSGNILSQQDLYTSNTLVGNLAVIGNLYASNLLGTHTGNIIGPSNVFGNLTVGGNILSQQDLYTSNTLVGNLAVIGNLYASNLLGTHTGNIIGPSNVFGNLTVGGNILSQQDLYTSNTIVGNLAVIGNLYASNLLGTHTGNIIGPSNVVGNLTVGGNILSQQDLYASNTIVGNLAVIGSVSIAPSGSNVNILGVTNPFSIGGALSDETTTITTSGILTIRSPYGFTVRSYQPPYFWLNTRPADYVTFDIQKNSNSIYSALPTILSSYTSNSTSSNTGTLINGVNTFVQGDLIQFKIIYAGSSGATGAKGIMYFS
jgi:hypothetical protein